MQVAFGKATKDRHQSTGDPLQELGLSVPPSTAKFVGPLILNQKWFVKNQHPDYYSCYYYYYYFCYYYYHYHCHCHYDPLIPKDYRHLPVTWGVSNHLKAEPGWCQSHSTGCPGRAMRAAWVAWVF